jgi:hypothetical protein
LYQWETSPTPKVWKCFVRNEFNRFFGESKLIKVDGDKDPRCSFFQDGKHEKDDDGDDRTPSASSGQDQDKKLDYLY